MQQERWDACDGLGDGEGSRSSRMDVVRWEGPEK
jgi:hypothetical protein